MQYRVRFTATFETIVDVDNPEHLEDAIGDIDIPETSNCQYVPESFNVSSVKEN